MSSTKNLPTPLFAKEGHDTSLWQREFTRFWRRRSSPASGSAKGDQGRPGDRRDFIIECLHTYELPINRPAVKGAGNLSSQGEERH